MGYTEVMKYWTDGSDLIYAGPVKHGFMCNLILFFLSLVVKILLLLASSLRLTVDVALFYFQSGLDSLCQQITFS